MLHIVRCHFHFRWKSEGKVDFILNILKWQQSEDVLNDKGCFILNFGYAAPLPFPDIKLSPNLDTFHLNLGTLGINSSNKCSIVVIQGKYLEQVDEVLRMVDKITEDIAWMPSAVFLMAGMPGQDIKFNVSTRHRRSPTMYQVPASRSSVVQFVMTCPGMSHSSTFTLHMRDNGQVDDGKVWGDLCREDTLNIAYINTKMGRGYEVNNETGEMVRYKVNPMTGFHSYISYYWEI